MRAACCLVVVVVCLAGGVVGPAAPPATLPAKDPTLDWLMGQATTAPATTPPPASKPAAPFGAADPAQLGYRRGYLITSDDEKVRGQIATTLDKPIRVWVEEKQEYVDLPFAMVKSMAAKVLWERDEREWHFKESGSDIKEYSGKTYPARELTYTITLVNGQKVSGAVDAPLYLDLPSGGDKTFVIHKRDKGDVGQSLKQLTYVKQVMFDD